MRIVITLLFSILTSFGLAQKDSLWQISSKVYIKAPTNIKVRQDYSAGPSHNALDSVDAIFICNELEWENQTHEFSVDVFYHNNSVDFMQYANDLDSLHWLSEEWKCRIMIDLLKKYDLDARPYFTERKFVYCSDYSITPLQRINKKYYYLDIRNSHIYSDRRVVKFLGIPYYTKKKQYESGYERWLLVDSVLYYFTVTAKKRVTSKKKRIWATEQLKPIFYRLVNGITIKEEEEDKPK